MQWLEFLLQDRIHRRRLKERHMLPQVKNVHSVRGQSLQFYQRLQFLLEQHSSKLYLDKKQVHLEHKHRYCRLGSNAILLQFRSDQQPYDR